MEKLSVLESTTSIAEIDTLAKVELIEDRTKAKQRILVYICFIKYVLEIMNVIQLKHSI